MGGLSQSRVTARGSLLPMGASHPLSVSAVLSPGSPCTSMPRASHPLLPVTQLPDRSPHFSYEWGTVPSCQRGGLMG